MIIKPKTKEELNSLKTEYESLNSKLKELSDDELKQVTGGSYLGTSDFMRHTEGGWYRFSQDKTYIYRVKQTYHISNTSSGTISSPSALLDRFWYNGSEAWYNGTVTEVDHGPKEYYEEISAPSIIHDKDCYFTKPYK